MVFCQPYLIMTFPNIALLKWFSYTKLTSPSATLISNGDIEHQRHVLILTALPF